MPTPRTPGRWWRRIANGLTAVLLAAGAGTGLAAAGAAPSYAATPGNVRQPGSTKITWSTIRKPWAVDAGATYSEHLLIESLQAHVHLHLAVAGSHTTTKTESFKLTLRAQTTDIVFHAEHQVKGTYTHCKCNVGGVNCPGSNNYKRPRAGSAGNAAAKFC